jgi:predicted fused transcriptional regulator/phosphomethylpyrimidine kinase
MEKLVETQVHGRRALVPADQLKKIQRKQALVAEVQSMMTGLVPNPGYESQVHAIMGRIRRLRIPPCVRFLD